MAVEQHPIVKFIESRPEWLKPHLPEGWTPDQIKRQALGLLQADKQSGGKIGRCTPASILLALTQTASLGLQIDTADAYLIPYGNEATLSIGWQGLVKLAKRGGEVRDIEAEVVLDGESCVIRRSSDGSRHGIDHEIPLDRLPSDRQHTIGAYCIITLADGSRTHEYMSHHDIEAVRAASKMSNGGAWSSWYGEMAKKAVIRRALKRFSLDPSAASALALDDRRHLGAAVVTGSRVSAQDINRRLGLIAEAPSGTPEASSVPDDDTGEAEGDNGELPCDATPVTTGEPTERGRT